MRCLNCQRLGHTRKRCKNVELCRDCGFTPPHEQCSRQYCVNCRTEDHKSYDSLCPTFWKHKSVNYLKITRRCTIREAWTIFNENPTMNTLQPFQKKKKTFAQIVLDSSAEEKTPSNKNSHSETCHGVKQPEPTTTKNPLKSSNIHTSTVQNAQKENKTPKASNQIKEKKLNLQHDNHSTSIHTNNFSLSSSNESLDQTLYSLSPTQHGVNTNSLLDNPLLSKHFTRKATNKELKMKTNENLDDLQMDVNIDGTGFTTPTRESSPCSQLYTKFPELNTLLLQKPTKKLYQRKLTKNNTF